MDLIITLAAEIIIKDPWSVLLCVFRLHSTSDMKSPCQDDASPPASSPTNNQEYATITTCWDADTDLPWLQLSSVNADEIQSPQIARMISDESAPIRNAYMELLTNKSVVFLLEQMDWIDAYHIGIALVYMFRAGLGENEIDIKTFSFALAISIDVYGEGGSVVWDWCEICQLFRNSSSKLFERMKLGMIEKMEWRMQVERRDLETVLASLPPTKYTRRIDRMNHDYWERWLDANPCG